MTAEFVPYLDEAGEECWVALGRIVAVRPGPQVELGQRGRWTEIVVDVGGHVPASIAAQESVAVLIDEIRTTAKAGTRRRSVR